MKMLFFSFQPTAHMATQQAGMGGIIQGGYDSDVEGGGRYNDNAGFESFSDKAVSLTNMCIQISSCCNTKLWSWLKPKWAI